MISDKDIKFISDQVFADFLNRLVSGDTNPEEWQTLVVGHFVDDRLEEIRRQLVRLSIASPNPDILSEQEKAQIMIWSNELLNQR
jgi:hypothetical protein